MWSGSDNHVLERIARALERMPIRQSDVRATIDASAECITYRIYTEYKPGLSELVMRYFAGATIYDGIGIWADGRELASIIEIVGVRSDLQRIADLAGDIKTVNHQSSVLVTWHAVSRLDV